METPWGETLEGKIRKGVGRVYKDKPKGQTCDNNLGLGSSGPSPADGCALIRPFLGLGGPWDLPAAVSRHPANTQQLETHNPTDPSQGPPASSGPQTLPRGDKSSQRLGKKSQTAKDMQILQHAV